MTPTQRAAARAETEAYVAERMREIALRIVESEHAGAYPDDITPGLRRLLSLGLTFSPELTALPPAEFLNAAGRAALRSADADYINPRIQEAMERIQADRVTEPFVDGLPAKLDRVAALGPDFSIA